MAGVPIVTSIVVSSEGWIYTMQETTVIVVEAFTHKPVTFMELDFEGAHYLPHLGRRIAEEVERSNGTFNCLRFCSSVCPSLPPFGGFAIDAKRLVVNTMRYAFDSDPTARIFCRMGDPLLPPPVEYHHNAQTVQDNFGAILHCRLKHNDGTVVLNPFLNIGMLLSRY